MSLKEILVPDLGGFDNVEIIELLVAVGDEVAVDDSIISLETDKATMEVPCPEAGIIRELNVAIGDMVGEGSLIMMLEPASGESPAEEASEVEQETVAAAPQEEPVDAVAPEPQPTAPVPTSSVTEQRTITVPDIGDFDEVEVIEVLVAPGDSVNAEDSVITLESDKASMEIPTPDAGVVTDVLIKVGDMIKQGDDILRIQVGTEVAQAAPEPVAAPEEKPVVESVATKKASPTASIDEVAFSKAHASPSVRRFARELGVDLGSVKGSGRKGRIVQGDVQGFVKQVMTATKGGTSADASGSGIPGMPDIDFSKWGAVEVQPLTKINKLTGKNLHRAWLNVPHVTQFDETDITDLEAFRKQLVAEYKDKGVKVTMLAFLVKALAAALKAFPRFNSSLDVTGENLVLKQYINIGVAVDTPDGLVVPVIKDADKKSLLELATEMGEISVKARDKKLKPADMQGGCITISSLGGLGGTQFTPIVNAPEVAILGVCRSAMKPVWNGSEFEPKLILPMALSYDHRVVDGAAGVRFTSFLGKLLNDPRRILL